MARNSHFFLGEMNDICYNTIKNRGGNMNPGNQSNIPVSGNEQNSNNIVNPVVSAGAQQDVANTQVLNLSAVEEVAKFEKKTSKKPAIIVGVLGLFAIIIGILYQPIMAMIDGGENTSSNANSEKTPVVENSDTEGNVEITCQLSQAGNADGTDVTRGMVLVFHDSKLQSYQKTLDVVVTAGNSTGSTTIQTLFNTYQSLIDQSPTGYQLSVEQAEGNLHSTITIDLASFDKTSLDAKYTGDIFTNVEFNLDDERATVEENLTQNGYTCS